MRSHRFGEQLAVGASLWVAGLIAAVWSSPALAHDLTCDSTANGQPEVVVATYPTTVIYESRVNNVHPASPSVLLSASSSLFGSLGWAFQPPPPYAIPVNQGIAYPFAITFKSYDECVAAGGGAPDFTEVFDITWDSGAAQCSTHTECRQTSAFACDDTLYVSSANDGTVTTTLATLIPSSYIEHVFTSTDRWAYEALGFNPLDNHLYAIANEHYLGDGLPHLLRIGADGTIEDLGARPELAGREWTLGTILRDGQYVIGSTGADWAIIDLTTLATTRTETASAPLGSTWAVNPLDGLLYGYQPSLQQLFTFDPVTGAYTPYGPQLTNVGNQPCSASFESDGRMFMQCRTTNPNLDTIFTVDVVTGIATSRVSDPPLISGDMASCPFRDGTLLVARDLGFYRTHEQTLSACLAKGVVSIAGVATVRTLPEALKLLWSSPGLDDEGLRRELVRESLVAECNGRLLPMTEDYRQRSDEARRELKTPGAGLRSALARLQQAHAEGVRHSLPSGFDPGPSTPVHAVQTIRPGR